MNKNVNKINYMLALSMALMLTACSEVDLCENHKSADGSYSGSGLAHNIEVSFSGFDATDANMRVKAHLAINPTFHADYEFKGEQLTQPQTLMPAEYRFFAYNSGKINKGEFELTMAKKTATVFGDEVAYVKNTSHKDDLFFAETDVRNYLTAANAVPVVDFSTASRAHLQKLALHLKVSAEASDPVTNIVAADISGIPLRFSSERMNYTTTGKAKLNFKKRTTKSKYTIYSDTIQVPTIYCANTDDAVNGILRVAVELQSGAIVKGWVNIYPSLGNREDTDNGLYGYDTNEEYIYSKKTDGQVVSMNVSTFSNEDRKTIDAIFQIVDGKLNEGKGWTPIY